jgi:hypothetical protein
MSAESSGQFNYIGLKLSGSGSRLGLSADHGLYYLGPINFDP